MRNLKKLLALVLSLMMVLSLMVTAHAADLKPDAAIKPEYQTAVDVLSALDVIQGDNGKYSPQGTITRAEFAVMLYRITTGQTGDASEYADYAYFNDVPAGKWYSGAAYYVGANGLMEGSSNNFSPYREITGHEVLVSLLRALGYGQLNEFSGSNWAVNATVLATRTGITSTLKGEILSAPATRQMIAQLMFRTITDADMVLYSSANGSYDKTPNAKATLGEVYFDLKYADDSDESDFEDINDYVDTDPFGRPTTTGAWVAKDGEIVVPVKTDGELAYSTTKPVKAADLAAALGLKETALAKTNVEKAYKDGATDDSISNLNDVSGGYGVLTEVYVGGTAAKPTYTVVTVNTYVVKVDAKASSSKAGYIDEDEGTILLETGLTVKIGDYEDGNFILYTKGDKNPATGGNTIVVDHQKAEFVSGTITKKDSAATPTYVYIDGEKYFKAATADSSVDLAGWTPAAPATSGAFYLDTYGNIVAYTATVPEVEELSYYYVLKFQASTGTQGGNDMLDGTGAQAKAQVLDPVTGAVSTIDIAVVKGTDGWYYADADGEADTKITATDGDNDTTYKGHYVSYVKTDLGNVLTLAADEIGSENLSNFAIAKGKAEIEVSSSDTKLANSATTLVVVTKSTSNGVDTYTAATYNGYKNFPKVDSAEAAMVLTTGTGDKEVATFVYVIVEEKTSETTDYAIYVGKGDTDKNGTPYTFILGGEEVSYYLANDVTEGDSGNLVGGSTGSLTAGSVYTLTIENGKLKAATSTTSLTGKADVTSVTRVEDGYVGGESNVYYVADGCAVYDATKAANGVVTAGTVAVGDTITLYAKDGNKAYDAADNQIVLIVITAHKS